MTNLANISATDIRSKWDKLTAAEAGAIGSVDALASQLMKSYSMAKEKAHADATAWVAGRGF